MRKILLGLVLCLCLAFATPARAQERTISSSYFNIDGWTYYPVMQDGSVYGFLCLLDADKVDGFNLSAVYYQRAYYGATTWTAYTWDNATQYDAIKYAITEMAVTVRADDPIGTDWGLTNLPAYTITPTPLDKVAPTGDITIAIIQASEDKEATLLTLKDAGFAVTTLKPGVAALKGDCSENNVLNAYAAGVEVELTTAGKGKMVETIYNGMRSTCYTNLGPWPDPQQIINVVCTLMCGSVNNVSGTYVNGDTETSTTSPLPPAYDVTAPSSGYAGARNCEYRRTITKTQTRTRWELNCTTPCKMKVCTQTRTVTIVELTKCEDSAGSAGACPDFPTCGAPTTQESRTATPWTPATCP